MANSAIRTRFAPSPTGFLHIGGLRTALYAYALAKHEKGDFILRIEDTDQKRKVEGATEALKDILGKFKLNWDELYVQSDRQKDGVYRKAAEKLINSGHAFYCQCVPKNAKEEGYSNVLRDPCRSKEFKSGAVKLLVPDGETVSYYDFVHKKEISWATDTVYDATLLKSDGFPTYHLAVVVDDLDMRISHVLRGHDWLPSTPIHLLIYKYFESNPPQIGHLTDILSSETGKKLSKRRDSFFVEDFLKKGYMPGALLNFVMLLGWAPKNNRELYTLDEFVAEFDINGFQEANPRFFMNKLDWINGEYIRKLTTTDLSSKFDYQSSKFRALDAKSKLTITKLVQDRIKKLSDFETLAGFFFEEKIVDSKMLGDNYRNHLQVAKDTINSIKEWRLDNINEALTAEINKNGFKTGEFFMDLRIAITGSKFTPPINESIEILGKDETVKRIKKVLS